MSWRFLPFPLLILKVTSRIQNTGRYVACVVSRRQGQKYPDPCSTLCLHLHSKILQPALEHVPSWHLKLPSGHWWSSWTDLRGGRDPCLTQFQHCLLSRHRPLTHMRAGLALHPPQHSSQRTWPCPPSSTPTHGQALQPVSQGIWGFSFKGMGKYSDPSHNWGTESDLGALNVGGFNTPSPTLLNFWMYFEVVNPSLMWDSLGSISFPSSTCEGKQNLLAGWYFWDFSTTPHLYCQSQSLERIWWDLTPAGLTLLFLPPSLPPFHNLLDLVRAFASSEVIPRLQNGDMYGSHNTFPVVRRTLAVVKNIYLVILWLNPLEICISPIFSQFFACVPGQMPFYVVIHKAKFLPLHSSDLLLVLKGSCI